MKGLIIKDLYQCKNNIIVSILTSVIISSFCLLFQIEYITPFIITTLISTTLAHSIITDKKTGWSTTEKTMPLDKKEIIKSKYIMYLLTITFSYIIGITILEISSSSISEVFYFFPISSGLILGSILIPSNYILGIDKSYLGMMLSILFTIFVLLLFYFFYLSDIIYLIMFPFLSILFYFLSYKWLVETKIKLKN